MTKKTALLQLSKKNPVETLPEKFISVALDASQIIGGYWWDNSETTKGGLGNQRITPLDLENETLLRLTTALAPYCLRIGGTEADRLFYSVKKKQKSHSLTEGYHYKLGRKRLNDLQRFCRKTDARLMITLNAGPGPRNENNNWRKKNARQLIRYSDTKGFPINVWELGNEVNAFPFFMGLSHRLKPGEYARDIQKLKKLIPQESEAMTAGPALAVWPILGETLPFMRRFLKKAGTSLDIITWHYYPQQSSRSIVASRRAKKTTLLSPRNLNEVKKQQLKLKKMKDKYQPEAQMWLGETGHALCGGEPGLSDTFYSGFWWLDQLGLSALHGQKQVIRQTLTGGDYGLLDKKDHSPLPDYWTTLLWNRYAGTHVYTPEKGGIPKLRLYLHSLKGRDNGYCLIYVSLEPKDFQILKISSELPLIRKKVVLTSTDIYSRQCYINGKLLTEECLPEGPRALKVEPINEISLPPLSYGFLILY